MIHRWRRTLELESQGGIRVYAGRFVANIFKKVIELSRIVPQETLFFDDSQKNLDAAASLGFKTFLVTPDRDIVTFFNIQSIDDF